AAPARRQLRPGRRADPGHRPGAAAALARHRHPVAPARTAPPAALVHLATPPPAPRPPSPPALECLRRDNTMITTKYSCRIGAVEGSVIVDPALDLGVDLLSQAEQVRATAAVEVPVPDLLSFRLLRRDADGRGEAGEIAPWPLGQAAPEGAAEEI